MVSTADVRTYVYGATYDSWNRVRTMTYPDGEVLQCSRANSSPFGQ